MTGDAHDSAPPPGAGGGRAEVDTSAPFKSVREAVDRFGGSGTWSSHLIKRMFAPPKKQGSTDESTDLEEQTAHLEKELSIKEKETIDVLKELESTKKFIANLKLKILREEAAASSICCRETAQADALIAGPGRRQIENAGVPIAENEERQTENAEMHIAEAEEMQTENAGVPIAEPQQRQSENAGVPMAENEERQIENAGVSIAEPEERQTENAEMHIAEPEERQTENAETHIAEPEERRTENVGTDEDMCRLDEQLQKAPGCSVLKELEQAKANLNRTTSDLAAIRASVDSLRNEIAKEKVLVEKCGEKVCSSTTLISSLEDELGQTKQKLQTLEDLQMRRDDPSDIFMEIKKMTSELEQLRNAAKASKSEAIMLHAEIEEMKASISTAEVRCLAARKIEEAARAAEALALAEIKILLSNEASSAKDFQGTDCVSLSVEEFSELAAKAQEADESLRKKVEAAMVHVDEANRSESDSLRKLEEAKLQVDECKKALQEALTRVDTAKQGKIAVEEALRRCRSANGHKRHSLHEPHKFKNPARRGSHNMNILDVSKGSLKPTLSIGQILSMKLMGPDGYDKSVSDDTTETGNVSLGQILNRRRAVVHSSSDATAHKKLSGKRKKFAFTALSVFLAKQAKSKKKKGALQN